MRKVAVWGFVVIAVGLLFTGAQAQRTAPVPTAPTSRPTQVEVTNFPAVQSVNGTVNVANLPAVQSVAGSVQVSNLPLDDDGNLRVAGIASGPTYVFTKISEGLNLTDGQQYIIGPMQTGGWKSAVVYLRMTGLSETAPGTNFCPIVEVLSGGGGLQFPVYSASPMCYSGAGTVATHRVPMTVLGPETTARITTPSGPQGNATLEVWLYLSD